MKICTALIAAALFLTPGLCLADAQAPASSTQTTRPATSASPSHVGVAVKVSTLGVSLEAAAPVMPRANIRIGFGVFTLNHDFDNDGIDIAAQLKMRSFSTYFDVFPFGGGFHISPGLMLYHGNEVNAVASVPGSRKFSLGDDSLISNPSDPVKGTYGISFEKVAPAILLGWGNIVPRGQRRWSIPFELGIVYTRAPSASIAFTGRACSQNGLNCRNIASDPTLQADVNKELHDTNDDLSSLKALPVISLGFSYKF
jgi:hypothetical protein